LAEVSQAADESEQIRNALENHTVMEDVHVDILEAHLLRLLIAEEAVKKYVRRCQKCY
jgi:hypothetical protein